MEKSKTLAGMAVLPDDRESLYELVWAKPAERIALDYNVSTERLAKKCHSLSIPRPMSGYWKMLEKGTAPARPPLRPLDVLPENSKEQTDIALPHDQVPITNVSPSSPKRLRNKHENNSVQQDKLIEDARLYFPVGRITDTGYLKPNKRKLLDLVTSDTGLDKILLFTGLLFTELRKHQCSVVLNNFQGLSRRDEIDEREVENKSGYHWNRHWKPSCPTLINIDGIHIGITIVEMSEKVATKYVKGRNVRDEKKIKLMAAIGKNQFSQERISTHDLPCGRLRLMTYSPYTSTDWSMNWKETTQKELSCRLPSIIKTLKAAVTGIKKQIEEAEIERKLRHEEWLIQQEKWRQQEKLRKAKEANLKSKEELFSIMSQWVEDKRVQQFFEEAEKDLLTLPEKERQNVLERLELARQFLSGTTALERLLLWKMPEERLQEL